MLEHHRGDGQATQTRDEEAGDDIDRSDEPECKLIQGLVTVVRCLLVRVVWLIDAIHPHAACNVWVLMNCNVLWIGKQGGW